ncbi:hypothetical protein VPG91_25065, partial [Nitrospirillum amazonense]|uniref:hypothetical protein n=1 Tax=Nitrospirillum amazonense TaxID=28077 RepID=UPI002DD42358
MTKRMDTRADGNKKIRHAFLLGASALAIGVSLAATRPARADTIVSTSGSSQIKVSITSTLVSIASGVVRSGTTVLSISAPVGTLINSGTINSSFSGINNQSVMGTLVNNGTISASVLALSNNNTATITNFINTGTLSSSNTTNNTAAAIYNGGKIGTLTNTGLIRGAENVLFIHTIDGGPGSIGLIANSGTLAGNIWNRTSNNLTIAGGSGSVVGTLTGYTVGNLGTIINSLSNLVLSTGNILLNDRVTITGHTLSNLGAAVTLNTLVSVTGNYNQSAGTLVLQGNGKLAVSNSATVAGTVLTSLSASNNYLVTGSVTTLVAGGTGSNYSSVVVSTTGLAPTLVSASGAASGNNLILSIGNDYVGGTLASIGNTGTLAPSGTIAAVYVAGTLGTLTNAAAGTLSAYLGVRVAGGGTLGQVVNSGLISGATGGSSGILSTLGAGIGTITNSATGTIAAANSFAAINASGGVIGTITNAGLISNSSTGVGLWDTGTVTQFNNSGTVRNQSTNYGAVYVGASSAQAVGTLNTLSNSGLIQNASASSSGTVAAILADGTVISGSTLSGTIGTVLNSGTISARTAIRVGAYGSIGTVVNSGTVLGNIFNQSTRDLTLTGGSGTTVGTFTGLTGTVGAIISNGNVVFGVGTARSNILLNDIVYTGGTVYNNSANISFGTQSVATISGAFAQTSTLGTLSLGTARLSITGAAGIAGTVLGSFDTAVNHTLGEGITLITADGGISLAYGTLTGVVRAAGTGINAASSISGNSLLAQVQNYYVATTYGTVTNTGTLTSTSAVYVAATGTLGAVSNTGVIQGNIVNLSSNDLTLLGGSAGTFGTFTGLTGTLPGSIFNTAGNVTLAGSILLDDTVNVGGTTHTVVADGATVRLNHGINITGNYSQTGGTLAELSAISGGELIVSGAAVVSGVNYTVVGATGAYHYLQGPAGATPIIAGGVGSSYTSITYDSGITGLTLGGYTQGTSLWGTVLNDYVGDSLASISIGSGTVLATPAGVATLIYIAGSGVLGTLSNSGTIQGNIANNGSADLNLRGGSATWGTFAGAGGTLGTITSTGGNVVVSGGQVYLADQVNVGSGLLYNTGGTLGVAPGVTVTGNYLQNSATGTLVLGPNAPLVVTGSAIISDGYIKVGSFDSLTNHVAGETTTLVQAGASSTYTLVSSQSVPVVQSNVGGLGVIGTQVGNNLQAVVENDYFGTSTAAFTQAGTIVLGTNSQASAALYVAGTATIGSLTNTGVLNGEANLGNGIFMGSSGTLGASIGTLVNSGTIAGRVGVANYNGVIGTIDNSGQILDSLPNSGIYNGNTIGLVNNQAAGTIAGAYGIANSNLLGTLLNAGLVAGSITSGSTTAVGVANSNYGTLNTLTNSGRILATAARIADGVLNYGTLGTLTNATGGTIGASGTIVSGTGNALAGVANGGTIGTLSNSGLVTATGTITAAPFNVVAGIANMSGGFISTLANAGTIAGNGTITGNNGNARLAGVFNAGTIGVLTNSIGATISGQLYAVDNYAGGSIGQLNNAGTITSASRSAVFNEGTIGTLSNTGVIRAARSALWLGGTSSTIVSLVNSGLIQSTDQQGIALTPNTTIVSLVNTGTILGATSGIDNYGTIGTLTNSGTIQSPILAIQVGNGGTIGTLVNSGTIAGSILNDASTALTLTGGSGMVVGVLTGSSGGLGGADKGRISSTGADLVFNGGNLLLNDDITATGRTVVNSGASLRLANTVIVTGNYAQGATGTLVLGSGALLSVTGAATVTAGTVTSSGFNATGNYLAGGSNVTLVQGGAGSSYNTTVVAGGGITGLGLTGSVSGNNLLAVVGNDYVGASLGSIVNSGSLSYSGASTGAVYVAGTGSLGTLVNSGTIAGSIAVEVASGGTLGQVVNTGTISGNLVNLSTNGLVLSGGTVAGTYTGGTITSTLANVTLASGAMVLGDAVNVGTGTLVNGGASVLLNTVVSVTGNYGQTGGTLNVGANALLVSGAAVITGGTVVSGATFAPTANYLAGSNASTLIQGGAGSSYSGYSVSAGSLTGLAFGGTTSGTNLVLAVNNDYVGTLLPTLDNSGSIGGMQTALFVRSTGSIGTVNNSGTLAGVGAVTGYGASIAGTIGTLTNSGLISGDGANGGYGLLNRGTIATLINTVGGTFAALAGTVGYGLINQSILNTVVNYGLMTGHDGGLQNTGTIQLLDNTAGGTIRSNSASAQQGLRNDGTIVTLLNDGLIGNNYGLFQAAGTIQTLVNNGTIAANASGVYMSAAIGTISNSGTITASHKAIVANAALTALLNSGTLSGTQALAIGVNGRVGTISNTGVIQGNIVNTGTVALSIGGGTGTVVGTLTGSTLTNRGTITSTGTNVVLSGNLRLNDNINVGTNTVTNAGGAITLGTVATITGNYTQASGTLVITPGTSQLSITGRASMTGGTVLASLAGTGNYLAGNSATLGSALSISSFAGVTVVAAGAAGLSATAGLGTVGTLVNLLLAYNNDYVGGTLATLTNTGSLSAGTAVVIASTGSLGTLSNTGTIAGAVNNLSSHDLIIAGGAGGTVGTFTGQSGKGLITNTLSNVVLASGSLVLNDDVNVGAGTLVNSGASVVLNTLLNVTGNYGQSAGRLDLGYGNRLSVTGAAVLTGGTVATTLQSNVNYLAGQAGGTLVTGGAGSSYTGVSVQSGLFPLVLNGTTAGNNLLAVSVNDYIGTILPTLANTGTINTAPTALFVAYGTGSLGTLVNSGTLAGNGGSTAAGVRVVGTLGTMTNSGLISAQGSVSGYALYNQGTIGTVLNQAGGTIQAGGTLGGGVLNSGGTILSLVNAGLIMGPQPGLYNLSNGTIVSLNNSGTIRTTNTNAASGIANAGLINTLTNSGLIASYSAIYLNNGTIGSLVNSGTISGQGNALLLTGVGRIGTLVNSGLIRGNIQNYSGNDLSIAGGTGGLVGTFTGAGGTVGTITNTSANVVFSSGALSLNDQINVGANTVRNTGASLALAGNISITGNYSQNAGTLMVNPGTAQLTVSGTASITGGAVQVSLSGTSNYLAGNAYTLVQGGAGSSYTGVTIATAGLTGLGATSSIATVGGNLDLLMAVTTDYVGTVLGSINNTGTLSGATALYIASTGSLGALANSGVIQGNIVNASANALTITGGAGGTVGTFTGQSGKGLITNTLSNVVLASGSLLLNDDVNVGGNTLVNSGASVVLNSLLNVTGNYGQSAGALMMAYGNRLSVTGAAVLTGGTIAVTGVPGTLNMLAGVGGTVALVTGGVGSGYTGLSYSSDVTGMEVTGSVGGNSLYLAGLNDYVGTVLGSLNNSGTISANNAVYVSATGTLGSLTNTGTLLGTNAALNNLGSIGTITIGTLTGTGTTTSYGTVGLLQGAVGITNAGSIGTLVSYATIIGTTGAAVDNQGSMYSLGNAGTITGVTAGINNAGSIGGLVNANQVTGSIGINNTGTIAFIQNFVFATDSLTTFIGSINGSATGLSNAGVVGTLVNAGAITGSIGLNNSGTVLGLANALFPTGSLTAVVGSITGSATGVRNTGVVGTLLNMGVISGGAYALYNGAGATLGTIANAGTINGNIANLSTSDLVIAGGGGTLTGGSISNTASNVVFAGGTQVVNDALNVGSHTVVNSGASLALGGDLSITGNYSQATGTLALSTNHLFVSGVANVSGGVITASVDAAQNYVVGGSNGAILIQGGAGSSYTGVSLTSGVTGLTIAAGVDTIGSNVDLVVAAANDYIGGTLGSLGNSGTITGVVTAAYIATLGSLGTLANSGLLAGAAFGVNNQGILGLVDNSGTISGVITAVYIAGTGSLGTLANSGVIQGGIVNASTNALTVTGGAGTVVGSLTGTLAGTLSTQGTITSTLANVVLGGGNLFLNDQVTVGSGTLVNSGASLRLGNGIAVLGNFSQSSGTLVEAYGNGALSVSGAAVMTGGTLAITGAPGTLNVLAGQGGFPAAVVGGTGSSYTGLSYDSGVAGLELTGSVGGNNLYVVGVNDYVGAALGTLSNTGTLSANNAVYVAATGSVGILSNSGILTGTNAAIDNQGSIGTLVNTGLAAGGVTALYNAANATLGTIVNSGTIQGNIVNLSAGDLVIAGNGTLAGTLTGGSISNMASNVVFAGGTVGNTQVLGDSIVNVGSHTVVNSGATVSLATTVSITGNYSQASGTLALGSNALMVSGVASIGGGVVSTTLDSVGNYIVGASTGVILVQGGAGSSYTGVDVLSGISGLSLAADTTTLGSNIDLVLAAANDYIGGTLASLNNTGTISGVVTAAYIGTLGSLGTLVNSGVLDGELYGIRNRGTIGLVDNSGTATGRVGLWNQGSIGTVLNTGTLKDAPEVNAAGLNNQGTIGAVINQGGTISSVAYGLYNNGTIASIANSGVISATDTVSGQGLHNSIAGVIGTINNSGTIAGVVALYNEGSIGTIANSGTIAGSIVNTSANALVFTGGTGSTVGTLTGTGGIGTITSTGANVELASGNLVLNDQVNV